MSGVSTTAILQQFTHQKLWGGQSLALNGPVGAGKTWLAKQIIGQWGIDAKNVLSPTFIYCHIHHLEKLEVHHYDLYRITDEEQLTEIGLWESMQNKNCFCIIEWADRFSSVLQLCNTQVCINQNHQLFWG